MKLLDQLITTARDPGTKKNLKYARYLYNDLVTEDNRQLLDEYTETLLESIRCSYSVSPLKKYRSDVSQAFYDYLLGEGKTPNTAYDYVKRVERICKSYSVSIDDLYNNNTDRSIHCLIDIYESGDCAEINKELHNAPLSALKQFKSFIENKEKE